MSPTRRATVAPLSADTYKLQVTISATTHDKLRRVRDLLRHSIPTGDLTEILDRALTLLLQDLERRRCATVARPREPVAGKAHGRHIPAAVKREVWRRDEGRCAFASDNRRCSEPPFSNSTMSLRMPTAALRRLQISSYAAACTISTRPHCSSPTLARR